jgi:hypothetical protein
MERGNQGGGDETAHHRNTRAYGGEVSKAGHRVCWQRQRQHSPHQFRPRDPANARLDF